VSVDVNSARATRGSDIETTAFNTNCEAAEEVARQLRLRDLGGLIVIDFIDMEVAKNQREVETRLKDALHYDRARVQMGKISRFGLMELSRQRLRPSLSEGSHVTCPRCNGTGHIRDTESSALQVLRIIQEEAMKENSASIHVQAPVDVAAFLLNEKRGEILKIETRHRVAIILIPNKHLETPHYKLERIKHDDPRLEEIQASYDMAEEADTDISYGKRQKEEAKPRQEAMVKGITPDQPAPIVERKPVEAVVVPALMAPVEEGFFSKLFGLFRTKPVAPVAVAAPAVVEKPQQNRERGGDRNGRGGQRGRNRNGRGGRERGEERDAGKPETREAEVKQPQPAQTARPPRPPREPREPREGNEVRPRNTERPQRPPREERKEVATEVEVDDVLLNGSALAAASSASASLVSAATPINEAETNGPASETGEPGEDQPRRRRRRGGRNRNRREREDGETAESGSELESGGDAVADASVLQGDITESTVDAAAIPTPVTESSAVSAEAFSVSETAPAVTAFDETIAATPTPAVTALTSAMAAPLVPQEVARQPEEAVQTPVAAAPELVQAAPTAPPVIAAPAVQEAVPATPPVQPVQAAVASAPMQMGDLHKTLASAGLTLAVTDPDKLRAAQEAAAKIQAAPHVPRERKPLPPQSTEPLTQVETQR
jgi:ribonuclease E